MPKPKQADRAAVAEKNITFRGSARTRLALDMLVQRAKAKSGEAGGTATIGSYLSALIWQAAEAAGVAAEVEREMPMPAATKKKR